MTSPPSSLSPPPTDRAAAARIAERRGALGLSRAAFCGHARCSLTFLTAVEGGAIPNRSATVAHILATLTELEAHANQAATS